MSLTKVTATGPDDTTHVLRLLELLRKYPKAEIGILMSPSRWGEPRFPSALWLEQLHGALLLNPEFQGRFSLHACDGYVQEFLAGPSRILVGQLLSRYRCMFSRVQINTHGKDMIPEDVKPKSGMIPLRHQSFFWGIEDNILALDRNGVEVIFQRDGVNNYIFDTLASRKRYGNISTLFDLSAGKGMLPCSWEVPIEGQKCGYAGGLSPENVAENIDKIDVVCNQDYWIDAEGRLMADDGHMNLLRVENYFRNAGADK